MGVEWRWGWGERMGGVRGRAQARGGVTKQDEQDGDKGGSRDLLKVTIEVSGFL